MQDTETNADERWQQLWIFDGAEAVYLVDADSWEGTAIVSPANDEFARELSSSSRSARMTFSSKIIHRVLLNMCHRPSATAPKPLWLPYFGWYGLDSVVTTGHHAPSLNDLLTLHAGTVRCNLASISAEPAPVH